MSFPKPQLPESMKSLTTPPKIHLYTATTPNGYKVSILLEELILAYPDLAHSSLSYDTYYLSFDAKHQKMAEFTDRICLNGRIPALVDDNVLVDVGAGKKEGHAVFESANCLLWLVENYDKENKFWFGDKVERSTALNWLFFVQGGVGPMQGQSNHFVRYAPEKIQYGIKRYTDETKRLYSVLEAQFNKGKGEWLVGDKYSIVDMNAFGWIRRHEWAGIPDEEMTPYPKLSAWIDKIEARPGAYNGLGVPERKNKPKSKEEADKEAAVASKWVMDGQPKQ